MLYRKAYEKLKSWKEQKEKTALCIQGARQIGKTTLVEEFGKNEYKCFFEFNFALDATARSIFDKDLDADTIIKGLSALTRKPMIPHDTLILFDEIQECPNARTAIKFLVQDGRFDYIETGSLLGVRNKLVRSLPVGFEELYTMYPMDFEEFLIANGVQQSVIDEMAQAYRDKKPVSEVLHNVMSELFYTYIIVGGMPKVVQNYITNHDIGMVLKLQNEIIAQYREDITKYAEESDRPKIRAIFDSIPSQLNDKNRRFIVRNLKESARLERYGESFNWLIDAGVANPCYNLDQPKSPLMLNEKRNLFKLYLGDTGLLCALSMDNIQFSILKGDVGINMGSFLENVMSQMFVRNGFNLHYFNSKKYGEVDFVLQDGTSVDLVEIKSGKDYKKHSALDNIISVDEWKPKKAIVFCSDNVFEEKNIIYLPWYMAIFFKKEEIKQGFIHKVDLSLIQGNSTES